MDNCTPSTPAPTSLRKHNFIDIAGQTFARLTAVRYVGNCRWECSCSCGTPNCIVEATRIRNGSIRSCGCLARELAAERGRRDKTTHGLHRSAEYAIWSAMRQRCQNPKHKEWRLYGGRGVCVCDEWKAFERFYADMGPRPSTNHSLDRTDNGLLYSKAMCRWATAIEQHNNTRRNHRVSLDGKTMTVAEWARELGIHYNTLMARLQRGWTVERALTP